MGKLSLLGGATVALGSFIAGWLSASQSTRSEVYIRRMGVYQRLNFLAADLFHLSIRANHQPNEYREAMIQARLNLSECLVSNAILVSEEVGLLATPLLETDISPDIDKYRVGFNAFCAQMGKDLKFDNIHAVTSYFTRENKSGKRVFSLPFWLLMLL